MNCLQSIVHDTHDKQTSQVIFVMSWKGWRGEGGGGGKHSTPSYNTSNSRFLPSFHDVNLSVCAELLNFRVTLYSRFQKNRENREIKVSPKFHVILRYLVVLLDTVVCVSFIALGKCHF